MYERVGGYRLKRVSDGKGGEIVRFERDERSSSEEGVIQLAKKEGLLRDSTGHLDRPTEVFRRAEFFFELWRAMGCPAAKEPELCREWASEMVGGSAFYREAVEFFCEEGPEGHLVGLYHWRDLSEAITWVEVGYFIYYLIGLEKKLNWSQIDPGETKVCVVTEKEGGKVTLNQNLSRYKSSEYIDKYFADIRVGARYLPLHLLCGYRDLVASGLIPEGVGDSWLLKEVTREESEKVIQWIVGRIPTA